jgi:hypothetical protein
MESWNVFHKLGTLSHVVISLLIKWITSQSQPTLKHSSFLHTYMPFVTHFGLEAKHSFYAWSFLSYNHGNYMWYPYASFEELISFIVWIMRFYNKDFLLFELGGKKLQLSLDFICK